MKKKRLKLLAMSVVFFCMNSSFGQDWGIGVRLGDPSGLTLKKHMDGSAFEISIGRTHMFSNRNNYYNNNFNDWYLDNNLNYKDFNYTGHKASAPIGIQLHYLIQKSLNKVADEDISGLEWYFGGGLQIRHQSYTYDYRYKLEGNSEWFYVTSDKATDLDFGIDGVIGLEYTFEDLPVSLFLDATLFMEIADNPFLFWGQGGIGARYRF